MAEYPEHEKLKRIKDKSEAIGDFLEWLRYERGLTVCDRHRHSDGCYTDTMTDEYGSYRTMICNLRDGDLLPISLSTETLLAEYFEINLRRLSEEKDTMLEAFRKEADAG